MFPEGIPQELVDLSGYVALEASDGIPLGLALAHLLGYVCLRILIEPHPHDGYGVEGGVGLPISSSVQPMPPLGLAGLSRYRVHPAKGCEGGLSLGEAIDVLSSRGREGGSDERSYAERGEEGGGMP